MPRVEGHGSTLEERAAVLVAGCHRHRAALEHGEGLTAVLLVCAVLTIANSVTFVLDRDTVAVPALELVFTAIYGEGSTTNCLRLTDRSVGEK